MVTSVKILITVRTELIIVFNVSGSNPKESSDFSIHSSFTQI